VKRPSFSPYKEHGSSSIKAPRLTVVAPMRRLRVLWVLAFFAFWVSTICLRLVWLQVFMHHDYVDRAARQQQRTFEVSPRRGILYDRNLNELAMTVLVDSIYAVPAEIHEADRAPLAQALSKVVHTDPSDNFTSAERIHARIEASRDFAWVARKQDPEVIAAVKALNLKGVYFQKEFKRFYPSNLIAAQVLGYVGIDDNGLGGIEQKFDEDLHGTPGHMLTAIDARRHVLGSVESDPLPGENLVLSLDANIQFMAEQALDHNMERTKALNGTVVVQDPHTGQILALAVRPTFNPNDFRHATTNLLRNHAVSDVYEPGSTFKLVTYSSALDQKITTPDSMIDCQGGAITIFGRTIHDAPGEHYHEITVSKALWESSDVAAVKLAMREGSSDFYKYMRAYGFGDRSGIELPSETRGLLRPVRRWGATSIGSLAIGQEIGVTPVQLVTMVSTIANGGEYLPPRVLLQSTDSIKGSPDLKPNIFHPETGIPDPLPDGAHRVISTMTSAEMRKMMEGVVLYGTGRPAQLNGYSAGGKTGTAQKIDPATHTYSKTKFVASFVGFAPVNNPAISIAVIMDSPAAGSHFGTSVSAPVFHELAQQILEYLGVPHDQELNAASKNAKTPPAEFVDEGDADHSADLNALFADVNELPADDPLRTPAPATPLAAPVAKGDTGHPVSAGAAAHAEAEAKAIAHDAVSANVTSTVARNDTPAPPLSPVASSMPPPPVITPATSSPPSNFAQRKDGVVVDASKRVAVPAFSGQSLRKVVEQAGAVGLSVQAVGGGLAREQAPAAGTLVPIGTAIVVRFVR
jgi:cell division protein FtsI (penicillin-binding protein 3)